MWSWKRSPQKRKHTHTHTLSVCAHPPNPPTHPPAQVRPTCAPSHPRTPKKRNKQTSQRKAWLWDKENTRFLIVRKVPRCKGSGQVEGLFNGGLPSPPQFSTSMLKRYRCCCSTPTHALEKEGPESNLAMAKPGLQAKLSPGKYLQ